jgi:hypothetical protein
MSDQIHQCWSVSATSYLRNLDADDLEANAFAVHYEAPPQRNDNGTTSHSLIMPMLLVTDYAAMPKDVADRVAEILNAHWDSHGQPANAIAALRAVEAAMLRNADGSIAGMGWSITALNRARTAIHAALREVDTRGSVSGAGPLPQDVIDLVIAAREAWEEHGASGDALDRALERFAARVPYDDQLDEVAQ